MIYEKGKKAGLELSKLSKFSYLHGLMVFWYGISFHLNYEIKYSAISHMLEFQNLISETQTHDFP